ncbi:hypothetical protein B0A49_04013 [Cryomyces minteri]|uniref:Glutamyl/glutaminyl-tRNA synthetase class Ib catalytic domain-containing protein n=1 Tax=Cryomyces minteri TaxID=331657 RepID=A0A4V5NIY3_9PEZI|nr:hypothetical protein B0A49_04013 [Cryomyces minteri]
MHPLSSNDSPETLFPKNVFHKRLQELVLLRGQFLLRIEDTDKKRTVPDAEQRLYEDLRWAGLQWDEGEDSLLRRGAVEGTDKYQVPRWEVHMVLTDRTALYREHVDKLIESGHGYRCFCSAGDLEYKAKQRAAVGLPPDYDRTCAGIPKEESDDRASRGEAHVVRLLVPDTYPPFTDLIYGKSGKFAKPGNSGAKSGQVAYEDPILLKTDGLPTYHLANVVDDHYMQITHVIRDQEGQKLSKRKFDAGISTLREKGIFPEALTNYVALLGWSHKGGSDMMTMQEMIEKFDMKFTRGNAIVTDSKLSFLQKQHKIAKIEEQGEDFHKMVDELVQAVKGAYRTEEYEAIIGGRQRYMWNSTHSGLQKTPWTLRDWVSAILVADPRGHDTAPQFIERNSYFFQPIPPTLPIETSVPLPVLALYALVLCRTYRASGWSSQNAWNIGSLPEVMHEQIAHAAPLQPYLRSLGKQSLAEASRRGRADGWDLETEAKREPQELAKAFDRDLRFYLRHFVAQGKQGMSIAKTVELLGPRNTMARLVAAAEALGVGGGALGQDEGLDLAGREEAEMRAEGLWERHQRVPWPVKYEGKGEEGTGIL